MKLISIGKIMLINVLFFACIYDYNEGTKNTDVNDTLPNDTVKIIETEGFIAGTFIGHIINNGNTTDSLIRGFCMLLKENKELSTPPYTAWPMDFYVFDLPESLYPFQIKSDSLLWQHHTCGQVFFPDTLFFKFLLC